MLRDVTARTHDPKHSQEELIAEIVEEHAGVEAERRDAVMRAESAESELSDAHRAARIVAIGTHACPRLPAIRSFNIGTNAAMISIVAFSNY